MVKSMRNTTITGYPKKRLFFQKQQQNAFGMMQGRVQRRSSTPGWHYAPSKVIFRDLLLLLLFGCSSSGDGSSLRLPGTICAGFPSLEVVFDAVLRASSVSGFKGGSRLSRGTQ